MSPEPHSDAAEPPPWGQDRFRLITESMAEVFTLGTLDPPRISYVSPGVEALYGISAADFLAGGALAALTHPADRATVAAALARIASEDSSEHETRIVRPDGVVRWVRVRLVRTQETDEHGNHIVASMAEDVTERKRAEANAARARSQAEEASRAKSELLSRMSHELRTPLNAILGFAQLLDLDDLTEEQRSAVRQITSAGRHLVDMVDDVLDISRVGVGGLAAALDAPRRSDPDGAPGSQAAAVPSAAGPAASVDRPCVVYVEDNSSNAELVARILTRRDVELVGAEVGHAGLAAIRAHLPQLVLLDLHLPDISGEEVLLRLRAEPATAHIPVVVISADASPETVARVRRSGADDYLTKPFAIPHLLAVVDAMLEAGTHDAAADRTSDPVLDEATIGSLVELDEFEPGSWKDLRALFLEAARGRLVAMRGAADAGDDAALGELAHTLQGSSATFGASRVAAACKVLQDHLRAGDAEQARSIVPRVEAAFAEAAAALDARFGST